MADEKKTLNLNKITLLKGSHSPDSQYCVMELAAYIAGESWSDHPKCVSPVITQFLIFWNDEVDDTFRQKLKLYAIKVIGTRTTSAHENTRAWMAIDWLVRTCVPAFLRLTPSLVAHAEALISLTRLSSAESAKNAQVTLSAVRLAAGPAAMPAAVSAARSAAGPAAGLIAEAAWSIAESAVRLAAGPAAMPAAENRLAPTVEELQTSALHLLDRMIAVGKTPVEFAVKMCGRDRAWAQVRDQKP